MAGIVVVGGGFGGLAAAIRLRASGHRVTLIEARTRVGGRAGRFCEAGHSFDTGPTIITAPYLLRSIWASAGRHLEDYVDLLPVRPFYEIRFRDGTRFAYGKRIESGDSASGSGADVGEAMEAEIARFDPADVIGFRRFMDDTQSIYQRGFRQLAYQPFLSLFDFLRVMPELIRLSAHRSVYGFVSRYIRDSHSRIALSFHPLFIGGNPFRASAIYSIVPHLERSDGVWFPRGGMYALVEAMERLFQELGGEVRCGDPVMQVLVRGGRVTGVDLRSGVEVAADLVVSNADVATTYLKLIASRDRRHNTDERLRRFTYSMSCFILYLGLDCRYPHLGCHTILMPQRYREVVKAIFSGGLLEDDLAAYLYMPSRIDSSLAPEGGETLYALVPVPNLASSLDWPAAGDRLRERVLALLEREFGLVGVQRHIVVERRFTPLDFQDELGSYLGAGFSIEPTLWQSACFRPHNRSEDVRGLYLVGAGTHPGAGLPGVLLSAEIAANLIGGG